MADFTQTQVANALANLGNYRVKRVQEVASQGWNDGISGSTLLALGLRETALTNIQGGLIKDADGKWIPQPDPNKMDVGVFQISRIFHMVALKAMPGVKNGTWGPVVEGKTAGDGGFVPRFEESLQYTVQGLRDAQAYAEDHGVKAADLPRFSVAAHNAGWGGALRGYREGNVDKYTTGGDYSGWVFRHRTLINQWLKAHPNWVYKPPTTLDKVKELWPL
jgi:hypothetical protein